MGVVDHTRNILSFMKKKLNQHGQVKNHACIFICEFVSNANRANVLTKLGFHKTCDRCNFCVRTDLRKAQQNTGNLENSQQELKRTRMENRKFKDLASFSIQYHLHSDALAVEYDDGFRKTCFRRKVRNARYALRQPNYRK